MERDYKAIIIGLGNIGYGLSRYGVEFATTHFEAYINNEQVNLAAVSDLKNGIGEEIKRKYGGKIKFYRDWRAMMKNEKPQVVSICTPDETHYEILKGVAKSPSVEAIWCEKPIAKTIKQGREMVELCRSKDIKLSVNYTRRYDEFYRKVKDRMQNLLGEVKAATCYYSGGITTNGSHMLDALDFFFGECVRVRGRESAGEITGLLEFKKCGTIHLVPISAKNYSIFEINILGEKGRLNICGKPFNEYEYRYCTLRKSDKINAQFISPTGEKSPFSRNFKRDYMDNALADLLESAAASREPLSSGETALRSLEILSALVYSTKNGEKIVSLPFTKVNIRIPGARGDLKKWQKKD